MIKQLSFLALVLAACQSAPAPAPAEKALVQAPAAVADAFQQRYPSAEEVEWRPSREKGAGTYKAKFKQHGAKMKAEFSTAGVFIKEERKKLER